jgi:hypothetical protein
MTQVMINVMGSFTPDQAEVLIAQIKTFCHTHGLTGNINTTEDVSE